jgi:enamine deaminase RidA (YjgF/YER057c/UK114 family)
MAESGIPDKLLPAVRLAVFWIALPFIFLLAASDRYFGGTAYEVIACITGAFLSIAIAVYWEKIFRRHELTVVLWGMAVVGLLLFGGAIGALAVRGNLFFGETLGSAPITQTTAEDITEAGAPIRAQLDAVTKQRDAALSEIASLRQQIASNQSQSDAVHQSRLSLDKLNTLMDRFKEFQAKFIQNGTQYAKLLNALEQAPSPSRGALAQSARSAAEQIGRDYTSYFAKPADIPQESDDFPQTIPVPDEIAGLRPEQQYRLRSWANWYGKTLARINKIYEEYGPEKGRLMQQILEK